MICACASAQVAKPPYAVAIFSLDIDCGLHNPELIRGHRFREDVSDLPIRSDGELLDHVPLVQLPHAVGPYLYYNY